MADRPSRFEEGTWNGRVAHFHKERVVVALKPSVGMVDIATTISSIISTIPGGAVLVHRDGQRWFVSRVRAGESIPAVAEDVATQHAGVVDFAEPDLRVRGTMAGPWPPWLPPPPSWWREISSLWDFVSSKVKDVDDPLAKDNWALEEISATRAWWFTRGDPKTLLGVIDSGIAMKEGKISHPDLDPFRFIVEHLGPLGVKPTNNYIDDEATLPPADDNGHGTHVTGILAARANNGEGCAGLNWESPVYVARVLGVDATFDPELSGSVSDVLLAVVDLVSYSLAGSVTFPRVVINLSLADDRDSTSDSMRLMCEITSAFNMVLCCGVASSAFGGIARPAALAADYDHVIAVAEIKQPEEGVTKRLIFPAVRAKHMILAPGENVMSTIPAYLDPAPAGADASGYYAPMSGSSMATPFVTGIVSLLWASNPLLTPAQIRECLFHTASMVSADYLPDGWAEGDAIPTGDFPLLHAGRALEKCLWTMSPETPRLDFEGVAMGATMTLSFGLHVESVCTLSFTAASDKPNFTVSLVPPRYNPLTMGTSYSGVTVAFLGTVSGAVTTATLTVKCAESGDTWSIPLKATTV